MTDLGDLIRDIERGQLITTEFVDALVWEMRERFSKQAQINIIAALANVSGSHDAAFALLREVAPFIGFDHHVSSYEINEHDVAIVAKKSEGLRVKATAPTLPAAIVAAVLRMKEKEHG